MKGFDQNGQPVTIPEGTPEESFNMSGITVRCYRVNGQRVLMMDDVVALLKAWENGAPMTKEDMDSVVAFSQRAARSGI